MTDGATLVQLLVPVARDYVPSRREVGGAIDGSHFPRPACGGRRSRLVISGGVVTYRGPQLTIDDFKDAVRRIQKEEPDISHWTFGKWVLLSNVFSDTSTYVYSSLKRGPDGKFKDSDLAGIIKNAYVTLPHCSWWSLTNNTLGLSIQPLLLVPVARRISCDSTRLWESSLTAAGVSAR